MKIHVSMSPFCKSPTANIMVFFWRLITVTTLGLTIFVSFFVIILSYKIWTLSPVTTVEVLIFLTSIFLLRRYRMYELYKLNSEVADIIERAKMRTVKIETRAMANTYDDHDFQRILSEERIRPTRDLRTNIRILEKMQLLLDEKIKAQEQQNDRLIVLKKDTDVLLKKIKRLKITNTTRA